MENLMNKPKPLTKEETSCLVSLIEGSKIINNKTTNATSNKLKVAEWNKICDAFNANVGICRRTPQQLRLKWENLKKNSRKRSTSIRMDRIKTGGGPPGYFPPDEILDRVALLLGSTVEGLADQFGGDAEFPVAGDSGVVVGGGGGGGSDGDESILVGSPLSTPTNQVVSIDYLVSVPQENETLGDKGVSAISVGDGLNTTPIIPKYQKYTRASGAKRRIMKSDDGRQARNMAIAEYYVLKKKILESKVENIKLENEKLKLEIRNLKGENV